MKDTILCVDIGTSSLKVALLPDNLSKAEVFVSRQTFPESAFENNNSAQFYLPALKNALIELREKNPDCAIEAICVSGNGPTVISDDGRTFLYSEPYKSSLNTKSLFIPRFQGFRERFPESWQKTEHLFGSPEYLLYKLTGQALSILPEERFLTVYWTESELLSCGFSQSEIKKIPPFVNSGAFVGKVSEEAALETGLLEGTFVFAGAPDFVVALIGTGTVLPGKLCDRAGTSEGLNLCTSKPVSAPDLRTMPSVVSGMWNLSYLGNDLARGINLLREAALSNGEYFPDFMTITGGQALNDELVRQKEEASGLKILKMPIADAELIGDLILARVALGDYDDIVEAVFAILGA